jgi:hypothetical protein
MKRYRVFGKVQVEVVLDIDSLNEECAIAEAELRVHGLEIFADNKGVGFTDDEHDIFVDSEESIEWESAIEIDDGDEE